MAEKCRARVCAVGTERDLSRLFRAMVRTAGYEGEQEPGEADAAGWLAEVQRIVRAEWGDEDQTPRFLYGMVCAEPYGDAWTGDCVLEVRREEGGLWTALMSYESETPFQIHDWLELHRRSGMVLMEAIYAEAFPGAPRGGVVFSGGRAMDDWGRMDAAWLYLISRWGLDEELVAADDALRLLLSEAEDDADWDEDDEADAADDPAEALRQETAALLRETADRVADAQALRAEMETALQSRAYPALLECQLSVAEARLWEADRWREWGEAIQKL